MKIPRRLVARTTSRYMLYDIASILMWVIKRVWSRP